MILNLSYILIFLGLVSTVFSVWSFLIVRSHVRRNKQFASSESLNDQKYFELKSRQELLVAISTILLALLSIVGYNTLDNIKESLSDQVSDVTERLDSVRSNADSVQQKGRNYMGEVDKALNNVRRLQIAVNQIRSKDIIRQNIYIVDPVNYGSLGKEVGFGKTVYFKNLTTVSGQKLPAFKQPPSVIAFSTSGAQMMVTDVTTSSIKVAIPSMINQPDVEIVKFSLWLTEKPSNLNFSDEFSEEFE